MKTKRHGSNMSQIPSPTLPGKSADFAHVRDWIFDLDNTLYHADNGVFAQIDGRMTSFVAELLLLDRDNARVVQKQLYRDHGTTLAGLIAVHHIDPEPYLAFVHDLDLSELHPDPAMNAALARLQGRRFVFTNGCRNHAARILERLGMGHLFDQIWDIRTIGFIPKPGRPAYEAVVTEAGLAPAQTAMFDDIARNLVPARTLGMTTVWLNTGSAWGKHGPALDVCAGDIDHETDDLTHFLQSIRI